MGSALFVIGLAGSGKTTFCKNLVEHGQNTNRTFHVINLDPANIHCDINYIEDIRMHITVDDVQSNTDLGPNGGLMLALEEMAENVEEFELHEYADDYLVFDCPGQIELFTHCDSLFKIAKEVKRTFKVVVVFLVESIFLLDPMKYMHNCLTAMISMARFEAPHINIVTKVDLVGEEEISKKVSEIRNEIFNLKEKYRELGLLMYDMLDENGMLEFKIINWNDVDSICDIVYEIDALVEYWDDLDTKVNREFDL